MSSSCRLAPAHFLPHGAFRAISTSKTRVYIGMLSGFFSTLVYAGVEDLTITQRWSVPLTEVSALALKDNFLYLASDSSIDFLKIPTTPKGPFDLKMSAAGTLPLSSATKKKLSRKSQWEGLAFDPSGAAFALKETKNQIFEFSVEGQGRRIIDLAAWDGQRNKDKGFEGLILLKKGHFILAQTRPGALIEYGPKGDAALGFQKATILREKLPVSDTNLNDLIPLNAWLLDLPTRCQPSDLAIDADDSLLILLKDCQSIVATKRLDPSAKSFAPEQTYRYPEEIRHAEGLVSLGPQGFLIGVDQKDLKNNVFWVQLKKPSIEQENLSKKSQINR